MLFSRWYTSPSPSVEGVGNVSRSTVVVAMFWLAHVKVGSHRYARSIAMAQPASSVDSRWCRSASLASTTICSSVSSPHCRAASHSMSSCRMCHRYSW
jgi:hypothetical protein